MVKVGRPRSHGYKKFGFNLVKQKNKFVAICLVCRRTLQNTAFIRLKGHRNICKPGSGNSCPPEPHCSTFVPGDDTFSLPNPKDFLLPDGGPQISSDGFMQNVMPVDSGAIDDDGRNSNFPSHNNADLQDRKHETDLKKVAVLDLIMEYKHSLFEDPIADKTEVWKLVLRKAKLVGLAAEDSHWTYARDSLYGTWKNRTLAKKDYLESDGWNEKLDIVDVAILKILDKKPLLSSAIDMSDFNSDCSLGEYQHNESFLESFLTHKRKDTHNSIDCDQKTIIIQKREVSIQTSDELHEAELRIKRLKCEVLEIEVYKQRLQVLQLERQLQLPLSTCTAKLFPEVQVTPTVSNIKIAEQIHVNPAKNNIENNEPVYPTVYNIESDEREQTDKIENNIESNKGKQVFPTADNFENTELKMATIKSEFDDGI